MGAIFKLYNYLAYLFGLIFSDACSTIRLNNFLFEIIFNLNIVIMFLFKLT